MKDTDKILIGIVAGIILLVVMAFVIALTKPTDPYLPDDTPEGVAHNYLLALQKEEYERAYGYLSPELRFYPESVDEFIMDVRRSPWVFPRDNSVFTIKPDLVRSDLAIVKVNETHSNGSLFGGNRYSNEYELVLEKVDDVWKISDGKSSFDQCWKTRQEFFCP